MKYCQYLNQGINFYHEGMTFCNTLWNHTGYLKYSKNVKKNINAFLKKRTDLIKLVNQKDFKEKCRRCPSLQDIDERQIKVSDKFKHIEIYHWTNCNCGCFYCSNRKKTKLKIANQRNLKGKITVVDYLKELKRRDLIDEYAEISMTGGEPTILKELPELCNFIIENNIKANILSNGIIYEQAIADVLKSDTDAFFMVSIDCGTRVTYQKIKRVDKFDEVIKNMAKYVEEAGKSADKIAIKYIILENVNDNKEEIDKWIEVCSKIGIKNFFVSIEFCHSKDSGKTDISEHICKMYEYAKQRVTEVNPELNVLTFDFVETFIKNRSYNPISYEKKEQ